MLVKSFNVKKKNNFPETFMHFTARLFIYLFVLLLYK